LWVFGVFYKASNIEHISSRVGYLLGVMVIDATVPRNLDLLPGEPQVPLKGSFAQRTTQPTRLLQPGDQLGSLRIIAAPGHSPDQIAFHDERDGTLIVGDAYQTQGGTAVSGIIRWRFPLPAMATWHLPTALQTAVHLHGLNPTRLATGHGPVLDTPAAEMAKAIVQAEKKVATP
jgi:glyoxylase-like metal-dependent hydrolase (beta-lactamase superfamily II)